VKYLILVCSDSQPKLLSLEPKERALSLTGKRIVFHPPIGEGDTVLEIVKLISVQRTENKE